MAKTKKSSTLLLVDDDPSIVRLLSTIIERSCGDDIAIESLTDPSQARTRILEGGVDILVTDLEMPVMNGLEASRRIRDPHSPVRNHRVPIIALTAAAMKGDRERCLEAGMDDYISKPLRPHQLLALVEKWIPAGTGRLNETGPTRGKPRSFFRR